MDFVPILEIIKQGGFAAIAVIEGFIVWYLYRDKKFWRDNYITLQEERQEENEERAEEQKKHIELLEKMIEQANSGE